MKTLLIILFLSVFSYAQAFEVTVYGRNSCGFTQALRNELAVNMDLELQTAMSLAKDLIDKENG